MLMSGWPGPARAGPNSRKLLLGIRLAQAGLAWPWAGLGRPLGCFWFWGAVFVQLLDYSQTRED